jgi:glucarate dehydratase
MLTDEGIEGWGECLGDASTLALLDEFTFAFIGRDPLELEPILKNFWWTRFYYGLTGTNAVAALECACWDITAKALGRPLVDLLGGSDREAVPVPHSIFQPTGRDFTAAEVVQEVEAAVEHAGLTTLKLKGGVLVPDEELVLLEALREAFPGLSLRLDPNGMWAVETTVRLGRRLEAVGLEYLEDPVWGVEPMSRARRDVRVPFATNMCVVGLADMPAAVRLGPSTSSCSTRTSGAG